ncbi:hypothetical protein EC968_000990 [Mortierella alpina]|nr:hypothetical protein EC968_000990 [Mortierella alpina]
MLSRQNIVVIVLILLGCATLTAAWSNKRLQNWGKDCGLNIFGEPIDDNSTRGDKPCVVRNLTKPSRAAIKQLEQICTPSTGDLEFCNHLPEDAILVDRTEFEHLFPPSDSPRPTQSQIKKD